MQLRHTLLASSLALALASLTACGTPQQPSAQQQATLSQPAPALAVPAPASAANTAAAPAVQQTAAAQAASAAYDFDMDVFHPVVAKNGMVATSRSWPPGSAWTSSNKAATRWMRPWPSALRWP